MGNHLAKAIRRDRKAPTLPVEILLEIVARADPATLVRFAASSKHLRRHITDPAFLRQYHADAGSSLLLGMFRQHRDGEPYRFVPLSPSTKLALQLTPPPPADAADDLFDSYVPVASRAGLVLLRRQRRRRRRNLIELCVCSPVTGRYSFLPAMTLEYDCLHVLLRGDDNTGHSFRLLVMDRAYRTQTFSSETGSWGPITDSPGALVPFFDRVQPGAVVLRGVAHWLCHEWQPDPADRYSVLTIRLGDGQAAAIGEVPELCLRRRRTGSRCKELLLVSTDGGQLGLLVAELVVISLWTLSEDAQSWGARRVVVNRVSMLQSVHLECGILGASVHLDLEWFGETTGAVVLRAHGAGILVLNLRTNEIAQLNGRGEILRGSFRCWPYEVDPGSLIAGLKSF